MFAGTAWAEVVNHGLEFRDWRCAIDPGLSLMSFLLAWCQHWNQGHRSGSRPGRAPLHAAHKPGA